MWSPHLLLFFASLTSLSNAASTFSPARPPAIPLAVKSPYVNCLQQAGSDGGNGGPGNGGYLAGEWPTFWAGAVLGWTGLIRVDGKTYTWMGAPSPLPTLVDQTAFEYTTTRSTFTMNVANTVEMTITFLSPLTPTDLKRQSLPFSYVDVVVTSMDKASHEVQLYTDLSAEWVSGDRSAIAQWEYGVTSTGTSRRQRRQSTNAKKGANKPAATGIAYHKFYRQTQLLFSEVNDQTEYGSWYWATDNIAGLTHQSGSDVDVRSAFTNNGSLPNADDTNYRAIDDRYPVFGFAVNLGSVGTHSVSTLFTLGLTQEEAVQFDGSGGVVSLPSLWTSYYPTDTAALSFFHTDYATAAGLATTFDNQVSKDSTAAGGSDYVTLTALAARQAFAATELAGNATTPYLFLKEISSDGNIQTVDMMFPFHPVLLYTNPNLLKPLLDPLFINQEAGHYPNMYSMHDLGSSFPNATGHPDGKDEAMPLEECGNMLIMTLAYAQRAKDTTYLSQHYNLLKQWTQYLIQEALIPANQISTDDFAGSLANQTNLALKGIIGIEAMAVIANMTDHAADGANYTNIAHSYINEWQKLGIAHDANPPHTTLAYGMNDTHGLLYNLYGDRELGLNLVPQSVYDMQSNFYPSVQQTYGVPLDTRHTYTKGDWEVFVASIAGSKTQQLFISDIAKWISVTPTNRALTDIYDTISGDYTGINFVARPAVGGFYSLLALPKK